jgi:hypothetical protein
MLIVFKYPKGIFIIDTSQINPVNWRYDPQSWAVGCSGPYGPVAIPNDVLFPDAIGHFHVLSRTGVERDAESSNIFSPKMEEWQRAQISPSRMPFAHLIYYDDKRMAYAAVSGLGSIKNDRRVTIDFNNPPVGPRFMYSDRDVVQSLVMRKIGGIDRPYSGDDVGKVWRMDESTRSKDGAGYIGVFQTDHSDLAEIVPEWKARTKSFDFLEFEFESVGNYNLSVNIYIDGVLKTVTPLAFSMSGVGVPLGSFVLDVDRLGVTARSRRKRRLGFHGTRISIEGFNSGPGETFRITEALVYGRVAE